MQKCCGEKAREKLDGLLNEDENWMPFSSGSVLNEEGLDYRLQLQKCSEKLGVIGDVLAAQQGRTAKTSTPGSTVTVHVHSLRDSVARLEAWNRLISAYKVRVHPCLQDNALREVCDECCETSNVQELMLTTALTETFALPYKPEVAGHALGCDTSIRSVADDARTALQHDLWIAALTTSFRDKEETTLVKELCARIEQSPCGFFPTEGFGEDVSAIETLTKRFLSDQNPSECQSFVGARERCKVGSKLMRQWCNLPLGIALLQASDECEDLARKVTFYSSNLDTIHASLKSPVTKSMGNLDAFSLLCQHASRVKHDLSCLLAGAGDEFSKLKETKIRKVVRLLEACVADLCLLRMKVMDCSIGTAVLCC